MGVHLGAFTSAGVECLPLWKACLRVVCLFVFGCFCFLFAVSTSKIPQASRIQVLSATPAQLAPLSLTAPDAGLNGHHSQL